MCFKNPKMDNQESIQEPPNQDLACSAQIYAAILRKLLEDIIQESEQDSISQEPRDEEGEDFQDPRDEEGEDFQDHNDFSDSGNNMHCRRND